MGVTGRRSAGPGPAGAAGEDGDDIIPRPHAHLTLAITPQPTANNYQHVQGGFVRSEPIANQPRNEEELQTGFVRRKRSEDHVVEDQDAAASSSEAEVDDDAAAVESDHDPAPSASVTSATSVPARQADDSDMFLEPELSPQPGASSDPAGQPQNLFPAFQPLFPLGHSRPPLFQEPAYSQRQALLRPQYNSFHPLELPGQVPVQPNPANAFRERAYPQAAATPELHSNALLGSGNFGVIHGGTFYGEDKAEDDYESQSHSSVHSFYGGNGHGRPAFYRGNPEPQRYRTSEDFFANFRDFAEISAPTKSSFSEFYVVYVNRNASKNDAGTVVGPDATIKPRLQRPNNIMERLAQLDHERATSDHHEETQDDRAPPKKLSLGKRKLALLKKTKKPSKEPVRDATHEPLLALS